jgi:heptaprenyl diphosphate synthase
MTDWMAVYDKYRPELAAVEGILRESVHSLNRDLHAASIQLIAAGGKRIRPLFAVLCSQFGTLQDATKVRTVAAALELVHMATLVHDDVIDDADLRRGRPTVRNQFGDRAAMYAGDFLFARAIHLLSGLEDVSLHKKLSAAIVRICEGEIEQIRDFYNWRQTFSTYLRRIERKTAILIAVSCELGAKAAGADSNTVESLRRFGYYTGLAFQIVDDLLDYEGSAQIVGKPVAGDLMQGNLTLPALVAHRGPGGKKLEQLVCPDATNRHRDEAVALIRDSGSLAVARRAADRCLAKAMEQLQSIPFPERHNELRAVASFVNQRAY